MQKKPDAQTKNGVIQRSEATKNLLSSYAGTNLARGLTPHERGFTLVELMIVMLIIGVLAAIAIPSYTASLRSAREATLKLDLQIMRQAIDSYTLDKEKAPQSLDDLVTSGYLKEIPKDPITQSNTTWNPDQDDALQSVDQTDPGLANVHSGSAQAASDGRPYSEW